MTVARPSEHRGIDPGKLIERTHSQPPYALWFLVSLVGVVKSSRHPNLLKDGGQ